MDRGRLRFRHCGAGRRRGELQPGEISVEGQVLRWGTHLTPRGPSSVRTSTP